MEPRDHPDLADLLADPAKQALLCGGAMASIAAPIIGFFGGLGHCFEPSRFHWKFATFSGLLLGVVVGVGTYFARRRLNQDLIERMQPRPLAGGIKGQRSSSAFLAHGHENNFLAPGTGNTATSLVLSAVLARGDRARLRAARAIQSQ